MSVYLVTGSRPYREHKPGETFEADLAADVEARAVALGAISLLQRSRARLQPGTWSLPVGWPTASEREE